MANSSFSETSQLQWIVSLSEKLISIIEDKTHLWIRSHLDQCDTNRSTIAERDMRVMLECEKYRYSILKTCMKAERSGSILGDDQAPDGQLFDNHSDLEVTYSVARALGWIMSIDDNPTSLSDAEKMSLKQGYYVLDRYNICQKPTTYGGPARFWDVSLGRWDNFDRAVAHAFYPPCLLPHNQLDPRSIFTEQTVDAQDGLLLHHRITSLVERGVLVIVPEDYGTIWPQRKYVVRVMDHNYPGIGDLILPQEDVPEDDDDRDSKRIWRLNRGTGGDVSSKAKGKRKAPTASNSDDPLSRLSFRDLDGRVLHFCNTNRPSNDLLFWMFCTAMVKLAWQVAPCRRDSEMQRYRDAWRGIWTYKGDFINLGTALAFSRVLGPELDDVLALGCADEIPQGGHEARGNRHWAPLLVVANDILLRCLTCQESKSRPLLTKENDDDEDAKMIKTKKEVKGVIEEAAYCGVCQCVHKYAFPDGS
ncbi:hypothetical protein B0T17DRAFT_510107 [Bombardia bombarda]|uniref:Uncharacterized protein n=1 Tax=Bombardia bombarda TaxID=252184 RepID=A0AA39WND3_9PEZI|nr:hypothetical protein B0T17DRAFT_510107 [Bombardia bombarda]